MTVMGSPPAGDDVAALERLLSRLRSERRADVAVLTPDLGRLAAKLLADNRHRLDVFGRVSRLVHDPGWAILLYLYNSYAAHRAVSLSDAARAASAPLTTVLRLAQLFTKAGLIEREDDWRDRRRALISLSTQGRALMEQYLAEVER